MCTTHRTKFKRFILQLEILYRKLQDNNTDIENTENDVDLERMMIPNDTEQTAKQGKDFLEKRIARIKGKLKAKGVSPDTDQSQSSDDEETVALRTELRKYASLRDRATALETQLKIFSAPTTSAAPDAGGGRRRLRAGSRGGGPAASSGTSAVPITGLRTSGPNQTAAVSSTTTTGTIPSPPNPPPDGAREEGKENRTSASPSSPLQTRASPGPSSNAKQ